METVQLIKENLSVKQLADLLGLRRNGKLYYCVNPMHRDDTASLSINERNNYFKCFGCDCGSDVIDLYCYYKELDKTNKEHFKTALKDLSNYIGIPYNPSDSTSRAKDRPTIPNDKPLRPARITPENKFTFLCEYDGYYFDERAGVYEYDGGYSCINSELLALRQVRRERLQRNKIIFKELFEYCNTSGLDESIYSYLSNDRKLSDDVISNSKLFSLNDIPSIVKHLTGLFDVQELQGSGILTEYNRLKFDTLHPIIIPYVENGEIVCLRARYFDRTGNNPKSKKYDSLRNDSLNLNRSKRFYNLDTLNSTKLFHKIYLTEGEIDCLSLETIGLKSIAIPGVNSLPDNLQDLINIHVVICFDNDKNGQGQKATKNTARIFKKNHIKYSVIKLPDGIKDVNEFLINEYNINKKC